MIELEPGTWKYLAIIAIFLMFFFWNKKRTKKINHDRKNRTFRRRYMERKKENEKDPLS